MWIKLICAHCTVTYDEMCIFLKIADDWIWIRSQKSIQFMLTAIEELQVIWWNRSDLIQQQNKKEHRQVNQLAKLHSIHTSQFWVEMPLFGRMFKSSHRLKKWCIKDGIQPSLGTRHLVFVLNSLKFCNYWV